MDGGTSRWLIVHEWMEFGCNGVRYGNAVAVDVARAVAARYVALECFPEAKADVVKQEL